MLLVSEKSHKSLSFLFSLLRRLLLWKMRRKFFNFFTRVFWNERNYFQLVLFRGGECRVGLNTCSTRHSSKIWFLFAHQFHSFIIMSFTSVKNGRNDLRDLKARTLENKVEHSRKHFIIVWQNVWAKLRVERMFVGWEMKTIYIKFIFHYKLQKRRSTRTSHTRMWSKLVTIKQETLSSRVMKSFWMKNRVVTMSSSLSNFKFVARLATINPWHFAWLKL